MTISSPTHELVTEIERVIAKSGNLLSGLNIHPEALSRLTARIRELEDWKAMSLQVVEPVLDYAHGQKIAPLGGSVTKALIDDHARLVSRIGELEAREIKLPPDPSIPEPPPEALDDSYMDAYHAAKRMRIAFLDAIRVSGIRVST